MRIQSEKLYSVTVLKLFSKRKMIGIASLCLLIFLPGCATKYVPRPINAALVVDCDYPVLEGSDSRALAMAYERRGEALAECTARMRALRK